MNTLRAYCCYLGSAAIDHKNRIGLIDHALERGKCSKLDMRAGYEERRKTNQQEFNLLSDLYTAKLKHLIWLTDQQADPDTRQYMQPEVGKYLKHATETLGISGEQLTLDMGVDTGISADSSRPLYDIATFMQLANLHIPGQEDQVYALPQTSCHRLSVSDLLTSIDRQGVSLPFYEADGRYRLPWQFED